MFSSLFSSFWYLFLYQPLVNVLVLIYEKIANGNLGWAVVWLTIFLRIVLLPLTILSERNNLRRQKAEMEAEKAIVAYRNDHLAQREAARIIMKKYHISPWAKAVMLGVQVLVLVLLYQVFIGGITGDKILKTLYPGVDFPGRMNVNFYGFDIGLSHDFLWSGLTAVYLFGSILLEQKMKRSHQKSDVVYLFFFPLFTFVVLWILPMVKSLFILTTMIFSDIIGLFRFILFKPKPVKKEAVVATKAAHH